MTGMRGGSVGVRRGERLVVVAAALVAAFVMLAAGVWCWVAPASFAAFVNWPVHEHFLHDLGAFQLGIGVMLLAALRWRDALAVVLAGATLANALHAINHAMDLDLGGGRGSDPWVIGAVALLGAAGFVLRVRALRGRMDLLPR
jgi:hypothetical protein